MNPDEIRGRIVAAMKSARDVAAVAENAGRDFTPEERSQVKQFGEQITGLKAQLDQATADAATREEIKAWGAEIGLLEPAKAGSVLELAGAPAGGRGTKTAGERFTSSPEWKNWMGQFPENRIPDSYKGLRSTPVAFGGFKDLLTSGDHSTSAGILLEPQRLGYQDFPRRPLVLRDLVSTGTTNTDTIEYVKQGTLTNNAAPVPEATTAAPIGSTVNGTTVTPAAAGLKPESGFDFEKVTEVVRTMANWMPATKRALSDAAQVRTIIDTFLRQNLEQLLEDEILAGPGTGEHFRGLLNTPGILGQAYDTDLLVTMRRAKTKVRTVGRATASAYVLNPEDNERIDLLRDGAGGSPNSGAFLFGGPAGNGVQTLWGLPRVECEAMPVGTAMVADWRWATVWDREQAALQVSDSHSDFFIRNLVAFLVEIRAAFGVIRPSAFVEIDLTA